MDRKNYAPAVGGSSLLAIFAVLCLTVFALLCLAQMQAGQRLSESSAEAAVAYYWADLQAQEILADLRSGQVPEGVREEAGYYAYECPISETQTLSVEVRLDGAKYHVLRWQATSSVEWETEGALLVWNGELYEQGEKP